MARSAFGVRRLSELRGWARASPILAIGLVIVVLGAVMPVVVRRRRPAFRLAMAGTLLFAVSLATWISVVAPGFQRKDVLVEVTAGAEKERERIELVLSPGGNE